MGDEVYDIKEGVNFHVNSPRHATIKFLHNGKILKESEGNSLGFASAEKGVYRVEAYIENRSWVFTNPIYSR